MRTRHLRWPALLLLPLCAGLYLPGLWQLPPVDRDEARFAQATRQMLASGDWVVPRVHDAPRLIKPIGIYWLQAAVVQLSGARNAIGAYRLPSLAGALVAVLATYAIGRRWFVTPAAWLGAACLATSALLVVETHLATTDAVLLACIAIAQGCLAALYGAVRRNRPGTPSTAAGFWFALTAGMVVKGPVAPLVAVLTVAALAAADRGTSPPRRSLLRALRPEWGLPLALACLAPWGIAVAASVGWRALPAAMAADLVPKLLAGHESHGAPPGAYLLSAPATFWPGSVAMVFAVATAWRRRRRGAERFLLAWLLPTWLLFECLPTKLPHYVLPTFPALALLTARAALTRPTRLRPLPTHALGRALAASWAMLTLAIGVAPLAAALWLGGAAAAAAAAASTFAALAIGVACVRWLWRGRVAAATWTGVLCAAAFYAPLLTGVLPHLNALWPSRAVAAAVARAGAARPLTAAGYHEPSLLFLTRPDVALLDGDAAAGFLAAHPDALAVVAGSELPAFTAAAQRHELTLLHRWSGRALNYSRGTWIHLDLFALAPAGSPQPAPPALAPP